MSQHDCRFLHPVR